jgi:hypothetical protein
MKILFINDAIKQDYMADMIFHGGKSLFGSDFYETNRMWYMYDDLVNKDTLYGRGFTMYGKISKNLYSSLPNTITNLISNKFFDKIIYSSIWRCAKYFDLVSEFYNKNDILIIDGEDELNKINHYYVNKGKYFKREYGDKVENVYPINFSIPEELIVNDVDENNKEKLISEIIPNFNKNYNYNNEKDYYNEYYRSWYAHTKKKGGWDCLRHYEIMMNGCVPIFENLSDCPKNTLFFFPKKEIISFSNSSEKNIDKNKFILEYTRKNLTTKNILKHILQ